MNTNEKKEILEILNNKQSKKKYIDIKRTYNLDEYIKDETGYVLVNKNAYHIIYVDNDNKRGDLIIQ